MPSDLPPHELRALLGQLGSTSGGGVVPGLAPAPVPNAVAYGTPGIAGAAAEPAGAPAHPSDPHAIALLIAQVAGEMFGGASVVPAVLPEDLALVRGGLPASPGVSPVASAGSLSPFGGWPEPASMALPSASNSKGGGMPALPTSAVPAMSTGGASPSTMSSFAAPSPGVSPGALAAFAPMPSSGFAPTLAPIPSASNGPSNSSASNSGTGPGPNPSSPLGLASPRGASPFDATAITTVPTWAPNPAHPVSGALATGDSLSHGAPTGQLASGTRSAPATGAGDGRGASGAPDGGNAPIPHPHVDGGRVASMPAGYGSGSSGAPDGGNAPIPHPHVDWLTGLAAPDARATTSSLARSTSAMTPGSSGALPADAPSGTAGGMPALAGPATATVPGFAPVLTAAVAPAGAANVPASSSGFAASTERLAPSGFAPSAPASPFGAPSSLDGLGAFEPRSGDLIGQILRMPLVGDTNVDVAPLLTEPSGLGLETSLLDHAIPSDLHDAPIASAPPKTSFGSSTPIRDATRAGFDPYAARRDFPILDERVHGKRLVWLDNAATTQKPRAVIDRLSAFYEHENSNIHRGAHTLAARATDAYEKARDTTRRFLNASSASEIIFVRGATEGINLVAKTWGKRNVGPGDEIVITHLEHHANIVPWQQLCAETGARLKVAPVDDRGDVILEAYERLLGPRTKLVSLPQVSNALGTITPTREMVEIAHRYGACVMVDGAQAVSHMRVDVQALDCDFYVFSGHKVFAPTGIGAVFGKRDVLEQMPPWQGGGNMIADVTFEKTTYQAPPFRFEAGTGNIADAAGLGAALDYVMSIGMDVIDRYEHELLVYATERLAHVPGLTMIGTSRNKAGVLSFVLDGQRTEDVGAKLDQDGIAVRSGHHCAQPILRRFGLEATVRASLAFYNVCEDIDALVESLLRIQQRPL